MSRDNLVQAMMRLRVVAADDNASFLLALSALLESEFDVVATASDGSAALERIRRFKPDVAVLDLEMPGLNGIEVTRKSMRDCSSPAIIICSVHHDRQLVQAAAEAGASGYVFKNEGLQDLLSAVKTVARGGTYFPQQP